MKGKTVETADEETFLQSVEFSGALIAPDCGSARKGDSSFVRQSLPEYNCVVLSNMNCACY